MITDLLLSLGYTILSGLLLLFPHFGGLPSAMTDALTNGFHWLHSLNYIFPIDVLLTILGLVFAFEIALKFFQIINWTINKIRGSG